VTLDYFEGAHSPEHSPRGRRTAILQLNAIAAPAGEMPVVLVRDGPASCCTRPSPRPRSRLQPQEDLRLRRTDRPKWPGKVTVVDNGRMPNRRAPSM